MTASSNLVASRGLKLSRSGFALRLPALLRSSFVNLNLAERGLTLGFQIGLLTLPALFALTLCRAIFIAQVLALLVAPRVAPFFSLRRQGLAALYLGLPLLANFVEMLRGLIFSPLRLSQLSLPAFT